MHLNEAYVTHLLRYVGVGLISGSIVHASTLGGGWLKYIVLITAGAAMFAAGVWLEHRHDQRQDLKLYTALSVAVSIGTGMVSGATQHYLDGPRMASVLLPGGVLLGYLAFAYRDHRSDLTMRRIVSLVCLVLVLVAALWALSLGLGEVVSDSH